jgi:purine-binding chemotaxis protein CheW
MTSFMKLAAGSLLEDESQLVVVCGIGGSMLGIPAGPIQEVLAPPEIRPVHHAPDYVRGVFNLRGRVIAVIDPAIKLGLSAQILDADTRILVVQSGVELVGMLVDSLIGIFPFAPDQITASPENLPKAFSKVVTGFFFLDGKMTGLLKLDELLVSRNTSGEVL